MMTKHKIAMTALATKPQKGPTPYWGMDSGSIKIENE
jgi:hypothetical protein